MKQPRQATEEERQADEHERTRHGLSPQEWENAFAWDEDSGAYVEVPAPTPGSGRADPTGRQPGQPLDDGPFQVWPRNWETVTVFDACTSQWRLNAALGFELDYAGVDVVLKRSGLADPDRTFAELQAMEARALEVLHG